MIAILSCLFSPLASHCHPRTLTHQTGMRQGWLVSLPNCQDPPAPATPLICYLCWYGSPAQLVTAVCSWGMLCIQGILHQCVKQWQIHPQKNIFLEVSLHCCSCPECSIAHLQLDSDSLILKTGWVLTCPLKDSMSTTSSVGSTFLI